VGTNRVSWLFLHYHLISKAPSQKKLREKKDTLSFTELQIFEKQKQ
jgi:hypothetical protein